MKPRSACVLLTTMVFVATVGCPAADESPFMKAFRNPVNDFSPGYFWMWNAKLDADTIRAQLGEMSANGIRSVCIHPFPSDFRPGGFRSEMSPDYLTPEYVEYVRLAVEHAARLGMHVWLYDEGGWPSGGACGQVAASDGDGRFRQRFLGTGDKGDLPFGIHARDYGQGRNSYPSIVEKGTVERFLALTHERYAKVLGGNLGKTVRYSFMDEPDHPVGWGRPIGWATDFAEEFKVRKGYDIMPLAKELFEKKYDRFDERIMRLRIDYYEVMGDLFVERFMMPLRDWCHAHGMLSSGHLNGEDVPEGSNRYGHGPLLKALRTMDVPGVDVIWRQLYPETAAGRGRQVPFPRYAASAAHQNGTTKVLSESCGIYGDSMSPDEMKWLVDYQMVRGVNMFVFGYYAMSYAGQWMNLFEPHSGPVAPYWDFQRPYFDYITRTSAMLAAGRPVTEIAVFYDERGFRAGGVEAETAGERHYAVARILDQMNCEYEFVDEEQIAGSTVSDGRMEIGAMRYSTIVVPTSKWMRDSAKAKLEAFRIAGGQVLAADELSKVRPTLKVGGPHASLIRVAKRRCGDETLYFLVNESPWKRSVDLCFDEQGAISRCDAETGDVWATDAKDGKLSWTFDEYGSALFLVGGDPGVRRLDVGEAQDHVLDGKWTLRRTMTHFVGEKDLERKPCDEPEAVVELGDWRSVLGRGFSGKAVYRKVFTADKAGRATLDLGRVCWSCSVALNGRPVGVKFFGPYRFDVEVKAGGNVLEVTVANLLANAISDDEVRDRIARDFPPRSSYDSRQRAFDRDNNESGLFGPVTLVGSVSVMRTTEDAVRLSDLRVRDPFVVNVGGERPYLLYMSDSWLDGTAGVSVSRSADLVRWSKPKNVLKAPDWCSQVWAPEIHRWKGAWYAFVTLKEKPELKRPIRTMVPGEPDWEPWPGARTNSTMHAVWIYRSESPEGPFLPVSDGPVTDPAWTSLDGTLAVEDGKPWMVFTHDWAQVRVGTYELAPLADDLSRFLAPPKTIFTAEEFPMTPGRGVTDGAYLYRSPKSGKLFMIWSTHNPARKSPCDYCVVLAESETGRIAGPWINHRLLFDENGGHGMFFRKTDGMLMLCVHCPEKWGEEHPLFLPVEDDGMTLRVRWEGW